MRHRILASLAVAIAIPAWGGPTQKWIDQAVGHDGKVWTVQRTVEYTFGGGELSQALTRYPNQFSLTFEHPTSGRKITWEGEKNVHPILFDVVNGTPWLVVNGGKLYSDVKRYGCPNLPYAFLRFDADSSRWTPVSATEAPNVLRRANLSYSWEQYLMENKRTQTPADIASLQASAEVSTRHFFSRDIPRTDDEWKYKHKKQYATRAREKGDCRPSLAQPVDAIFPQGAAPPSRAVSPEILEDKRHAPEWVFKGEGRETAKAWKELAWDKARHDACKAHLQPADPQDQRLVSWLAFIAEPSRRFAPGHVLCDADAVWFFSYVAERGRVVIVKTNTRGDILYRVSFPKPDETGGYQGGIMNPTLRAADGYLTLEWWNVSHRGYDVLINRTRKMRIKEP